MGSLVEIMEIHGFTGSQGTRPNATLQYINVTWASWLGRFSGRFKITIVLSLTMEGFQARKGKIPQLTNIYPYEL